MRVAIIGSGPSGFYAAEALLKQTDRIIHVDMFDRLPTPFGLVRIGVAPDHQSIKTIARVYEKTAARPNFRFMGNVCLGRDVSIKDLRRHYHQIVYAIGNEDDRRLGIPGEGIARSTPASVFIGWYNGHPDYKDAKIDLSVSRIAVVGHGNVALDVARILLHDPAELEKTDITAHALEALRQSKVREIFVLGRRGPKDATFTPSELRAFGELENVEIILEPGALADCVIPETEGTTPQEKNLQIFQSFAQRQCAPREKKLHLRFWVSPTEVIADAEGKVTALALEKNCSESDPDGTLKTLGTGEIERIEVGMMLSAIGYAARRIEGIPYDEIKRIIANENGRVVDPVNRGVVANEYVVGWARSGPQGLIGSHKGASARVVDLMMADADGIEARELPDREAITAMLYDRGVQTVSFNEWKILDDVEIARGALRGAPRDKIADVEAMLTVLAKEPV
jgi:ferredoxin--NADP+ reductase